MITTQYGQFQEEKPLHDEYVVDRQTGRFIRAEKVRERLINKIQHNLCNYHRYSYDRLVIRLDKIEKSLPVIDPIIQNRYFLAFLPLVNIGDKAEMKFLVLSQYNKMCEELYGKQEVLPLKITKTIHCHNCDKILAADNGKNRQYCPECNDNGFICNECKEYFDNEVVHKIDGQEFCGTCFCDLYTECYHCGDMVDNDNLKTGSDENSYCGNCFDERFFVCDDCDEVSSRDSACENQYGHAVCESCGENYFTCENCNGVFHNDRYGNNGCCDNCTGEKNECIHDYSYRPSPEFFKLKTEKKNELYFGIELEIENTKKEEDNNDIAEYLIDRNDFIYCKEDGSLNTGFEIVTHPLSWEYYLDKKKKFAYMCDYLKRKGFESHNPGTCGMHIHLSKKAFTTIHLYKVMTFFFKNPGFITTISQRKKQHLDRWSSLEDNKDDIVYKAKNKKGNSERYVAINLKNEKTVEIRIFRGTLKTMSFFKNMEFIKAVFEWTKITSINEITIKSFLKYVHENKKDYSNLIVFLMARKLTNQKEV